MLELVFCKVTSDGMIKRLAPGLGRCGSEFGSTICQCGQGHQRPEAGLHSTLLSENPMIGETWYQHITKKNWERSFQFLLSEAEAYIFILHGALTNDIASCVCGGQTQCPGPENSRHKPAKTVLCV